MNNYLKISYCSNCPYFKCEKINGSGSCTITNEHAHSDELCAICTCAVELTPKKLAKLLHHIQKWRRGGNIKMPSPILVGVAIDNSIRLARFIDRRKNDISL